MTTVWKRDPKHSKAYIPPKGLPFPPLETSSVQLQKIVTLFPKDSRDSIKWSFLVVAPDERAQLIARDHATAFKGFEVEGDKIDVGVGWMMVESADEFTNVVLVSFVIAPPPKRSMVNGDIAYVRTNFWGTTFRCRYSHRNAAGWNEKEG